MEKKHFAFLIFSGLLIAISMLQCDSPSNQKKQLSDLLEKEYKIKLNNSIKRIFVLNDTKCPSCLTTFSEYVKKNINDSLSIIIVQSRGWNIDVEGFIKKREVNQNIIVSQKINTTDSLLSNTGVIYLNKHGIDTIIRISPLKLKEQISFIREKEKRE